MNLSHLQLLSFEIGDKCNLAKAHPYCPVNRPERHLRGSCGDMKPMTDDKIITFAEACIKNGFSGHVAWHYYNEPMLDLPRILGLLPAIPRPSALWTNGELIDPDDLGWIERFDKVFITDHNATRRAFYKTLMVRFPGVVYLKPGGHDDRIDIYAQNVRRKPRPCYRPERIEMIVDFYGEVHLCCMDWAATTVVGNIQSEDHQDVINSWCVRYFEAATGELSICSRCQSLKRGCACSDPEHRI